MDFNSNIVNVFSSITEAEKITKIKHISCVLSGRRNHAGGYKCIREY